MSKHDEDLLKARNDQLERRLKDLPQPMAFTAPCGERTHLWVQAPSGRWLLLEGSWAFDETARLLALSCGYQLIDSDTGLLQVEAQMNRRVVVNLH